MINVVQKLNKTIKMKKKSYKNFNLLKNNLNYLDKKILKKIFYKMSYIRQFELEAYRHRKEESYKTLVYLSLGQESIYSSVAAAFPKAKTFGQHRGHGIYLAYKGDPQKLTDELLGLSTGANKGMGGSPSIFDKKIGMFGHVGLIGDQVPVSCGYSLINQKETVICFFGDGAAEEDYVLASMGFAVQKKLNIIFICDDNNLSVLTPTSDRRTWKLKDVASSFGIKSFDITDDPLTIYYTLKKLKKNNYPALLNIRTCREYWHEGAGKDKQDKYFWNRYEIVKKQLLKKNENNFIIKTEKKNFKWAKELWEKRLQKL